MKQVHRIRALFHRQLSVPLVDLKSTLANYKLWEAEQGNISDLNLELDGVPANVVSAYQKALEIYNARRTYENELSKSDASDADRLPSFMVRGYLLQLLFFFSSHSSPHPHPHLSKAMLCFLDVRFCFWFFYETLLLGYA